MTFDEWWGRQDPLPVPIIESDGLTTLTRLKRLCVKAFKAGQGERPRFLELLCPECRKKSTGIFPRYSDDPDTPESPRNDPGDAQGPS